MNQFFNNLFGAIANQNLMLGRGTTANFIPLDANGATLKITGQDAIWLGLQNRLQQKWAYEYCYPLASVVDRLAEFDISGELKINRTKGKGREQEAMSGYAQRMRKLFAQPNPLQSWEQFRGQQVVYKKVFGFCPVLPVLPVGFSDPSYATAMINLPPWTFQAIGTGKILNQSLLNEIVKEYHVSILGENATFLPEQIIILSDGFLMDEQSSFLLPKSKIVGLDMAISNICAAMEADNVLLKKRGPLGFISHDAGATKDSVAGYLPMSKGEKKEIEDSLMQYGISWSQYQYVISRQAIKWNPMSFDTKQLGTKEVIMTGARAICQRYGFPFVLFEDSDATYSNQESAHKKVYEGNIIPNNCKDMTTYEKFFLADENSCEFETCYEELAIFQEDAMNTGNARRYMDEGLQIEYQNDIITRKQWLDIIGMDAIGPEGDLYYSQSPAKVQKDAQAQAQADAMRQQQGTNDQQPGAMNGQQGAMNGQQMNGKPKPDNVQA
jgi:hypothetical protein